MFIGDDTDKSMVLVFNKYISGYHLEAGSSEGNIGIPFVYDEKEEDPDSIDHKTVPHQVRVYEISGPMFFGVAERIAEITLKDFTKCLVIRMRGVPALDATAMRSLEQLYDRCQKSGVQLVFSHVNEQPLRTMEKDGFIEEVGKENFCAHIDDALKRAAQIAASN